VTAPAVPGMPISHSKPSLGTAEIEAAGDVLASHFVAPGERGRALAAMLAQRYQCQAGLALNSCTSALHLTLMAIGAGPGDRVAVPGLCCPAVLNPIAYVGAQPALVDVAADDHQVDVEMVVAIHARTPLKAVIVPHRYGHLADVRALAATGMTVIEDFAHSLGALRPAGGAALQGTVGVFSFYATKMLATGCGGALVTNDAAIAESAAAQSDYYGTPFVDQRVRYNYRMPDLNAAVGISQLQRLDDFVARRRAHARRYVDMLKGVADIVAPAAAEDSSWYRFVVRVPDRRRRDAIFARAQQAGCGIGAIDIAVDPARDGRAGHLPVSRAEWGRCVSLPIYPDLSPDEQQRIVDCIRTAE
jgi:dTDP-4-amino-4,6-dideoxygalactose transaminase